ncbi:Uncharacterised protein [Mycobacterium tuberculosis]|uniref:Uncharacterized protein n=1 Tax=Mycobacterium tuberculosis TaxID=1773 RepID=A0A655JEP6_MYCTX|nr:Uncharacterised protein [Mycobacterium tuberculosis]
MHQPWAHPPRHIQRVGARSRGVREVQRVMRVVAVQRVVGRRERRDRRTWATTPLTHPFPGLAGPEKPVRSEGKHVFNGHHHGAGRF